MKALTSGTMAGTGSFRCQACGYLLTLTSLDALRDCPGCGGHDFVRASLFDSAAVPLSDQLGGEAGEGREWLAQARDELTAPGEYLLYLDGENVRTVPLTREWTRIGRSLAADVRFDDPTVSRRHALVVRQADGVRVLDDRSLNGVFVNGERVEWRALQDGDEIVVGRYLLAFASVLLAQPMQDVAAHTVG
ncbi:MAG TPA: FHA domain-containing protein [Solirubrobacteraceae bacterium]|jgi:predicted  nucleic acid-binding Zn-ribbon protein|nr:FHA domain-containing protein [Solirubrobacteraceae bacterium]